MNQFNASQLTQSKAKWKNKHCTKVEGTRGGAVSWDIALRPYGTMALRLTQPQTEMSTRNISWVLKAAGAWIWQTYHLHVPTVLKSGSLSLLEPSGLVQALNGITLPLQKHKNMVWLAKRQCASSTARWARHQSHLPLRVHYRTLHYGEQTRYLDMQHVQSCKSPQQTQQLSEDSWGFIPSGMSYFLTRKVKSVTIALYLRRLNGPAIRHEISIFYSSVCLLI